MNTNTNDNKMEYAYVCIPENAYTKDIAEYCRAVYLSGYYPVCPELDFKLFLDGCNPNECADGVQSAAERMKTCSILIVCEPFDRSRANNLDIAAAQKLGIPTTSLAYLIAACGHGGPISRVISFDAEYGSDTDETYNSGDVSKYENGYMDGFVDGFALRMLQEVESMRGATSIEYIAELYFRFSI